MTPENQLLREALAARLRAAVLDIRRKPYPISDLIPLLAQAADALTQSAQPAEGGEAREFFAYHSDMGAEFFNGPDAEAAAKSLCDENLKLERAEAISTDEWADDRAESIRWGVVLGRAKFFENPGQEGEDSGDYKMVGYTAPPASHVSEADFGNNQPASQEPFYQLGAVMSWGGFNLYGNPESIAEARRLKHEADKVPELMARIRASQEQAAPAWSDAVCDAGFQAMEARGFRVGASDIGKDDMKAMFLAMVEAAKASQEQAQQPSEPHLFEFWCWWETHMPQATQAEAWAAWQAAQTSNGVGIEQQPSGGEVVATPRPDQQHKPTR